MEQSPEKAAVCDCFGEVVCEGSAQRQIQVELVMSKFSSHVFEFLDFTSFTFF